MRLNKFLAERIGIARREADYLIAKGRVMVDGKTATLGEQVTDGQKILLDDKQIENRHTFTYLMLNKP